MAWEDIDATMSDLDDVIKKLSSFPEIDTVKYDTALGGPNRVYVALWVKGKFRGCGGCFIDKNHFITLVEQFLGRITFEKIR